MVKPLKCTKFRPNQTFLHCGAAFVFVSTAGGLLVQTHRDSRENAVLRHRSYYNQASNQHTERTNSSRIPESGTGDLSQRPRGQLLPRFQQVVVCPSRHTVLDSTGTRGFIHRSRHVLISTDEKKMLATGTSVHTPDMPSSCER